jgi:hypothetical protein
MHKAASARSFEEFLFDHPAVLEPPVGFLFLAREPRDFDTIIHICLSAPDTFQSNAYSHQTQ